MEHVFSPPAALRIQATNLQEEWQFFKQRFELYMTATGSDTKPAARKAAIFLHVIGEDALKVFNSFNLTAEQAKDLSVITSKFEEYCTPRKNVVYERYLFGRMTQATGETVEAFVTSLRLRAKSCEFGDQLDSLIRDRLVIGSNDQRVQERMLREAEDLTLEKALSICRAAEATKEQMKTLRSDEHSEATPIDQIKKKTASAVDKLRRKTGNYNSDRNSTDNYRSDSTMYNCRSCGQQHVPRRCPAYGKECYICKRTNHFAKCCRNKAKQQSAVTAVNSDESDGSSEFKLDAVLEISSNSKAKGGQTSEKAWRKTFYINGSRISCKLDSGAEANVMSRTVFESLKYRPTLQVTRSKLHGFDGSQSTPMGTAKLKLHHKQRAYDVEFFVIDGQVESLIGLPSCVDINLLCRIDTITDKNEHILNEFADVFEGIGCMPGEHHIVVDPAVQPVVHPARRVPLAIQPRLKQTLEKLERKGIIVKRDEPTDWVNSLLILEKHDHSLRLCLDPSDLNKAIKREHYPIKTVDDIASRLHGKRVFSVIDISNAFYNVKLDAESSKICTFNSIYGRWSFCRLPFGISSSPEVFCKRMEQLFGDIDGVHIVFDDMIIAASDTTEHDEILKTVLSRARKYNVKFNKDKLQLRVKVVKYLGHLISAEGLIVDPSKVRAITEMPPPTDKKSLIRLLGMIAYVSKFIPNCSALTDPLRKLCKNEAHWWWSFEQQQAFEQLKRLIAEAPVLRYFDPSKPVTIQTDSSSTGLGSCLMQEGQPLAFASRALTDAETRYAQIEKECLAIVFACEKFHTYIYGRKTYVQSDHKPLEAIFKKPVNSTSPRLQRMRMKLLRYDLEVGYKPGKDLKVADALSRAYLLASAEDIDYELVKDVTVMIHTLIEAVPASSRRLDQFRAETARDPDLVKLRQYITDGWPTYSELASLSSELKQYKKIAADIYVMEDLLFVNEKLIVPASLRPEMLKLLHEGHLGIEKCTAAARQSLYWVGLTRDIERMVSGCHTCCKYRKQQAKESLMPHPVPQRPWQKVGADLFSFAGRDYLLVVDYHSKFPEIALLEDKTSHAVILQLKIIFARHGIPEVLVADNMPFGSKACKQFAEEWDVQIKTSSPNYAQSNGQSERHIQTIKKLMTKAAEEGKDPYIALLQYRNTPLSGLEVSPAQLLFSRRLRTKIPTTAQSLLPATTNQHKQLEERQQRQKQYYDAGSRDLQPLQPGDVVRVKNDGQWQGGKVVSLHELPRSYIVQTENGSLLRRNRRHLIKTSEEPPNVITDIDNPEVPCDTRSNKSSGAAPGIEQRETPCDMRQQTVSDTPAKKTVTRTGRVVKTPARYK